MTWNSSILLTVVTAYGLNQLGLDSNRWPLFVTEMHTNPGRLYCANTRRTEPVLTLFLPRGSPLTSKIV